MLTYLDTKSISYHVYACDKSFYTIGPITSLHVEAYIDRLQLKDPHKNFNYTKIASEKVYLNVPLFYSSENIKKNVTST